jgi:hypothetical protein
MPVTLREQLVLLCEGDADRQFFRKLIAKRAGLPQFEIPFPTDALHGNTAFGGMLDALRSNPAGLRRVRGVLIVADATDKPSDIFNSICNQIRSAGGFPVPNEVLEVAHSDDYPCVAIMLVPLNGALGCLETLLIEEILSREGWVRECVEKYFQCNSMTVNTWPVEKREKARFHSMIAVTNKDDPSKAASQVFKDPNPVIAVEADCFAPVAQQLVNFGVNVGAYL